MSAISLLDDRVLFSPDIAPETNALLQSAVAVHGDHERAEQLLQQARHQDPDCLQTYFALYKFYFYSARLEQSEAVVRSALAVAARQGNFPDDIDQLCEQTGSWDLYASEAGLFYLYTLKALAFIQLRLHRSGSAEALLAQIARLDPEDRSGATVIMALAAALETEDD